MSQQQAFRNIIKIIPIEKVLFQEDLITMAIKASFLKYTLLILKNHINCQFKVLASISAADYPGKNYNFKIIYELSSIRFNKRVYIKLLINESVSVDSCDTLYSNAIVYENRVLSMTGIFFKSQRNINRLLACYGFTEYPSKRGFPLGGYLKMREKRNRNRILKALLEFCLED